MIKRSTKVVLPLYTAPELKQSLPIGNGEDANDCALKQFRRKKTAR